MNKNYSSSYKSLPGFGNKDHSRTRHWLVNLIMPLYSKVRKGISSWKPWYCNCIYILTCVVLNNIFTISKLWMAKTGDLFFMRTFCLLHHQTLCCANNVSSCDIACKSPLVSSINFCFLTHIFLFLAVAWLIIQSVTSKASHTIWIDETE